MFKATARRTTAVLVLLLGTLPGYAQSSCEDALRQAGKSYELGLFEDVPGQLAPCLDASTSRTVAVQVHTLLAKAYLGADELAKAREEVSTLLRLDPSFEPGQPPRFAQLVEAVRREQSTVQVLTVSKTPESLREAPATVIVITAEEIERRGYVDLVQLLEDLPGFDISRTNGEIYAAVYQRGYRSTENDRILLLLDGVEQNELGANVMYLSRQFALSNIDRVEVIYGLGSVLYGGKAHSGVISIITKEPEALIPAGRSLGLAAQAATGSFDTRSADFTLAGRQASGNVDWSLTGHAHRSEERFLSRFEDWDFSYDSIDYMNNLRITGPLAQLFVATYGCAAAPTYECRFTEAGDLSIEPTAAGERLARELDRRFVQENRLRFADPADDWSLYGQLKISDLTLGFETWRLREGSAIPDLLATRSSWAPRQTIFSMKYAGTTGRDLSFRAFVRYQQSSLARSDSRWLFPFLYANGFLGLSNLVQQTAPSIEGFSFGELSSQLRSEVSLGYEPSERFSAVGGIELWKSSIQSQTDAAGTGLGGILLSGLTTPRQTEHTDLAAYAQVSYRPRNALKLVLSGRLNNNQIDNQPNASGFGTVFSPRAAVVYMPAAGHLVFKAIYSEAVKEPSDFQQFGTVPFVTTTPSNGLRPERVRNVELNAGWQRANHVSLDASIYQADYSDVVSLGRVASCDLPFGCYQYQNRDAFRIRGLQVNSSYRSGRTGIWANYTYTAPYQTRPVDADGNPLTDGQGRPIDEVRIGDIAKHRMNLGLDTDWSSRLKTDLRLHSVGSRKTGQGTTVPFNPFTQIDAYSVVDATLSYGGWLPHTTLQLIVDNVFDRSYFHPGAVGGAVIEDIKAPRVPQPGRTVFVRILWK